jgi:hypothetical protein
VFFFRQQIYDAANNKWKLVDEKTQRDVLERIVERPVTDTHIHEQNIENITNITDERINKSLIENYESYTNQIDRTKIIDHYDETSDDRATKKTRQGTSSQQVGRHNESYSVVDGKSRHTGETVFVENIDVTDRSAQSHVKMTSKVDKKVRSQAMKIYRNC